MKKSEVFKAMEESFSDLKDSPRSPHPLNRIRKMIRAKFDLDMEISVVKNKNREFFGMSIFPKESIMADLVSEIIGEGEKEKRFSNVVKMWGTQKEWVLEIDEMLLTDMNLNANPAEMTAVLLHEIGHVIYDNSVPSRFTRVIRYNILKLNYKARQIVKWKRVQRLLQLTIIEACTAKSFSKFSKEELSADKFAASNGYGEELSQFIDKLLRTYGNGMIDVTEDRLDQEASQVTMWSIQTIQELEYRKNTLADMLKMVTIRSSSMYTRNVILKIREDFFSEESDKKYSGILKESVDMQYKEYTSSCANPKVSPRELVRVRDTDINMIEISMGKIETVDDKLYVLDKIRRLEDQLEYQMDVILLSDSTTNPTMPKDRIKSYLKELDNLRKETIKHTIISKKGTFFRSYPNGYQG